jgi:ribosomal protein L16 Arg81 hydroxylase
MLQQWLSPTPVAEFVRTHLRQQPAARPDAARLAMPRFDWNTLDRVLRVEPEPDLIVIAKGKPVEGPAPRSLADVRALMKNGVGLVIRRAERLDPGLTELAASFARDLPGEVHLQLFVTPAETHGFSWHYDFEDVFIVQTDGAKEYFFRENTVDLDTPSGGQPDFTRIRTEKSDVGSARLEPGDWLYLPRRWWHVAHCVRDSLSISVGVDVR